MLIYKNKSSLFPFKMLFSGFIVEKARDKEKEKADFYGIIARELFIIK